MLAGRPRRAEDRHGGADVGEPVEAGGELGRDVPDPLGVGGPDCGRLVVEPQQ
jgi:hypothetical protein